MRDGWLEFGQVALAHLLAVASPGPDFAIVLRQSLAHGRRIGVWTSLGVGAAILLHVAYSLLGVGLLIRSSSAWFDGLRFAGAAYLGWLGVQALRAGSRKGRGGALPVAGAADSAPPARRAFTTGFLTNALNPKATLFFVALFSVVISPGTPKLVQAGYGVWMALATAAWFTLVSLAFTHERVRQSYLQRAHWIDRALGVVFLGFAVSLAWSRFE